MQVAKQGSDKDKHLMNALVQQLALFGVIQPGILGFTMTINAGIDFNEKILDKLFFGTKLAMNVLYV